MPFTRPTSYANWVGTREEPTGPEKTTGWLAGVRPKATYHNFLFGILSDWINWLDQQMQLVTALSDYDATVGAGGTFADINTLMASGSIATLKKILITSPLTLTATQVINQDGMEFVFKPQAIISKSLSVTPGFSINANNTTFRGGRFNAFSVASDIGVQIETGKKNNMLLGTRFVNCDTGVNDLGTNNLLQILEEV